MDAVLNLSLTEVADAIRQKRISSEELTRACLARIEVLQPRLRCFIAVDAEQALADARAADHALAQGALKGSLHGVPLAHKDMYYRAGRVSTCGSRIRRTFVAGETATALVRLENAGALHLGTLNMSEFGSSPTGLNDEFGDCRTPWNLDHISGGSSSGPASATAARLIYGALGSDAGGSIRTPAALCGITGLKPTYARISRFGAMPFSFSMDHVGPLARTARDCARLLTVLAGSDLKDRTCSRRPVPDYEQGIDTGIAGVRVGVPTNYFMDDLSRDVGDLVAASLKVLESLGARIIPLQVPDPSAANAFGATLARSEASTIHARWLRERPQDYMPVVREWMEMGLLLPATRYIEALNMRGPTLTAFKAAVFSKVDLLHVPTVPIVAPTVADTRAEKPGHGHSTLPMYLRPFNYLGLPSVAVPCGFAKGLPTAFQLVGAPFREADILRAAHAYQTVTSWHMAAPHLT